MSLYAVRNKFGNTETYAGGMVFASKLEARRYSELIAMQRARLITGLKTQERFTLQPAFVTRSGEKIRKIEYVADFVYRLPDGQMVIEETKGFQTDESKIKMKMVKYSYPDYDVRMVYEKAKPKHKAKAGFGKGVVK